MSKQERLATIAQRLLYTHKAIESRDIDHMLEAMGVDVTDFHARYHRMMGNDAAMFRRDNDSIIERLQKLAGTLPVPKVSPHRPAPRKGKPLRVM